MNVIKQQDIEYFITDFENNSKIELVEASKEKDELYKIASHRGIKIKGSRDLAVFKTIYGFTDRPNQNGAILPQKDLLKVLPQIVGKPISVNHNRRFVVGHYIDYRYIQKSKQIVAYGIFYKSNFGAEWAKAQKLFKKKKLSSSFEIWVPEEAKKFNEDGTYEMHQMEIAGGALVFQDKDNEPAFEGADVLAIAKVLDSCDSELVYAKKHKETEILNSNMWKDSIEQNKEKLDIEKNPVNFVTCAHCQESFETVALTDIKCPKCFSILKQDGSVLYPPQLQDFKIRCLNCEANDWLILNNEDDRADLRCKACSKEYTVNFKKPETSDMLNRIEFVYVSTIACPQCGTRNTISGTSKMTKHEVNCGKCGLKFNVDTKELDKTRQIDTIAEKSSEERRNEEDMAKEEEKTVEEVVKDEQVEEVKKTEEVNAETPKAEEKPAEDVVVEDNTEEVKEEVKEDKAEEVVVKSSEDKEESTEASKVTPELEESSEDEKVSEESETTEQPAEPVIDSAEPVEEVKSEESQAEESDEVVTEESQTDESTEIPEEEVEADVEKESIESEEVTEETPVEDKEETVVETASDRETRLRKLLDRAVEKIVKLQKDKKLAIESATVQATEGKDVEIAKIKEDAEAKIEFAVKNARLIVARRHKLGKYANSIEDKDIVKDEVYEKVLLEKRNAELRARQENGSEIVTAMSERTDEFYSKYKQEIDRKAFGHQK